MKHLIVIGISAVLAGCASIKTVQSDCEQSTTTFVDMAACIDRGIGQEQRLARSDSGKLYRLKAAQLAARVEEKKISELDARVELQQLFVQIRNTQIEQSQRAAAISAAQTAATSSSPASRPVQTNCYRTGNSTNCTSW